ncbi:YjgN family protein [Pseudomonas sp. Marseille-QA0892]
MSDPTYSLVFSGEVADGFDREQVKQNFAEFFKLSADRLETLFSSPRVVLKRGLSELDAERYLIKLNELGANVRLESSAALRTAPSPAAREIAPPLRSPADVPPLAPPAKTPPPARGDEGPQRRRLNFQFTGNGTEFFRIWIVNVLLTIVTLGIYSAWAKVRTNRYFHGNTRIDESSFEYLAKPMQILKGRIIAFVLLIAYSVIGSVWPAAGMFTGLLVAIATPWLIVKGLSFRFHNTAWRGVRFGFDGSVGRAIAVFVGWPLLAMLTLGLLSPVSLQRQQQFIAKHVRYGSAPFTFKAGVKAYYVVCLIGLLVIGVSFGAAFAVAAALGSWWLPGMAAYLAVFVYFRVALTNLFYSSIALRDHNVGAHYRYRSYAALVVTNGLAMLFTLGLFYPWAKVRTARYAAEHCSLDVAGDLEGFVAEQRKAATASGGEVAEFFSVDLGL